MNTRLTMLLIAVITAASVSACGKNPEPTPRAVKGTEDAPGQKATTAAGDDKQAETGDTTGDTGKETTKTNPSLTQLERAQDRIDLQTLPNDMTICSINGKPLSVGDYRRAFKWHQFQIQSTISTDPKTREQALNEANKKGIKLSPDEEQQLISTAKKQKGLTDAGFKEFLKANNATEAQFNKQISDIGLAYKTANVLLQQSLLNDLVNQQILVTAGTSAGLGKKAMQRYSEIKHAKEYNQILATAGLTPDQFKEEVYRAELMRLMMQKIQKTAKISDAEARKIYTQNKDKFNHGDRIRLSQIIIAAPTDDMGPVQSIRSQVKKSNPKLTGKELDAAVEIARAHQRKRAEEILQKARGGEDFAKLSNEYTDDIPARANKTGGDIGWQEKAQLIPQFAEVVWPLKVSEIYPKLVQTNLGYHIVKKTGHEKAGVKAFAEVEPALKSLLQAQSGQESINEWIQKKRGESKIVLSPKFTELLSAQTGSIPR